MLPPRFFVRSFAILAALLFGMIAAAPVTRAADESRDPAITADTAEAQPAAVPAENRDPKVELAIIRLRQLGVTVREIHPRNDPDYWIEIIFHGNFEGRKPEDVGDAAMSYVAIIARGRPLELHLHRSTVTPAGLQRLTAVGRIEMLELTGPNVDDEMLQVLPKLPLTGRLKLESKKLTDAGIEALAECRQLVGVSLEGALLTDDCLHSLTKLPHLREVRLGRTFTIAGITMLRSMQGLTRLDAPWIALDVNDLKTFSHLSNLRQLSLVGSQINDDTAEAIASSFPQLEKLSLYRNSLTNAGVRHLARLQHLKVLALNGGMFDDGVAADIGTLKELEYLSLDDTAVGDQTFAATSACPKLWGASFSRTRVTDAGLAGLSERKALRALYLSGCQSVTDDSAAEFARLADDEQLFLGLQGTGVSREEAVALQKKLPNSNITWGVPAVPLK